MHDTLSEIAESSYFVDDDVDRLADFISAFVSLERRKDVTQVLTDAADALRQGDLENALSLLLYAQRLSPSNRLITLFIGDLRLALRLPEAAEPFEFIAKHTDWRGAWYRLAFTRAQQHNYLQAAADLHESLIRNAPFRESWSCKLASDIATATSSLGWCGVNNSGRLFVGGKASSYGATHLNVQLDGVPVPIGTRKNDRDLQLSSYQLPQHWITGTNLKVLAKGVPLIGSPVKLQSIIRTEGFVSANEHGLQGWTWFPGEPSADPSITIEDLDADSLLCSLVASSYSN